MEHWRKKLLGLRASKPWLRVKYFFLPHVVVVSHYRSGFQWFRQICRLNLYRHVVMPPQARYQHHGVERLPPKAKLDRNVILLVRDGRDVMVSLYLSSTVDGPGGTRRWEGSGEPITFPEFLRTEFMRVRNWKGELLRLRNPADYWSRFNADWLDHPDVVCVVRYEDLLADQAAVVRRVKQALGYGEDGRQPVELDLDFDKHSPVGGNVPAGYRRRTAGSWERVFDAADLDFFERFAGATMRRLGYLASAVPGAAPTPAPAGPAGTRRSDTAPTG